MKILTTFACAIPLPHMVNGKTIIRNSCRSSNARVHAACCVHHCLCTPKNKKEEKKGNAASFTGFCLNSNNSKFIRQNMSSLKRRKVATTEYKLVHICQACRMRERNATGTPCLQALQPLGLVCVASEPYKGKRREIGSSPLTVINNMIVTILSKHPKRQRLRNYFTALLVVDLYGFGTGESS